MNKKRLSIAAVTAMLFLAASGFAGAFEGPLQVKNYFPLFMNSYSPRLETALPEQSFSAGFSYTSVFLQRQSAAWKVDMDMELAELRLGYRHKLGDSWELSAEVPVLNLNRGFMDDMLGDFHRALGLPNYGREQRPKNEFLYEVRKDGLLLLRGRDGGTGLGDIRVSAKKMLLKDDPVLSVAAGIELPTGDPHKGYGNGSVDAGLTVLLNKGLSEGIMSYVNAGVIFPGNIKAEQSIDLRNSFFGGFGLEAMVSQHLGLLGQLMFQSSPFPKTGIGNVDRVGMLAAFGARYTSGKDSFELSMTEDPNTAGAPDFTVNISYKRRF